MKQFVLFIRNREDDIYVQYITEFFKYIGCMVTDVTIDRIESLSEFNEYINNNNYDIVIQYNLSNSLREYINIPKTNNLKNELSLIIDKFWNNDEELKLLLNLFEKNQLAEVFYLGYLAKEVVGNGIHPKYTDNLIDKLADVYNNICNIETNNIYFKYAKVYTMYYLNLFSYYGSKRLIFNVKSLRIRLSDIINKYPFFLSTYNLFGNISSLNMGISPNPRHCCEDLILKAEIANFSPDMYLNVILTYIKKIILGPYENFVNYDGLQKGYKLLDKYKSLVCIKNERFMFEEIFFLKEKGNYKEAINRSNDYLELFLNGKQLEYISPETLQYAKRIYKMMAEMYDESEMYVRSINCLNNLEKLILTNNKFFTLNGNFEKEYRDVYTNIKEINDVYYYLIVEYSHSNNKKEIDKNYAKIKNTNF